MNASSTGRVIYVLATPAPENLGLISREQIEKMQPGALLVLISRAHLVDFAALVDAADKGKIQAAIDVFPTEPVPPDATVRSVRIQFCHRIGRRQSVASAKRSAEWWLTSWRSWRRGFPPRSCRSRSLKSSIEG